MTTESERLVVDTNHDEGIALTSDAALTDVRYESVDNIIGLPWIGIYGKELRALHYRAAVRRAYPDGLPDGASFNPGFEPDRWVLGKWWGNT